MAWDFGSEEIKEMGQLLLRDGSGSISTPHQQHTRHGCSCIHKGNAVQIFTEPHSPRASNTRCSSNINVLFHTTAWLRSLSKISSPEQHICLPFLQVQHLLRSCPHFTDGEIESQKVGPDRAETANLCPSPHPPIFDKLFCPDRRKHK